MRTITEIIVHCTDTPEGRPHTVDDIKAWHINDNGWKDIGYHYLVTLDGEVQRGRPIENAGAHCSGHNAHSIGVCYVGGRDKDTKKPKDTRTQEQRTALRMLLKQLCTEFPNARIYGHRDFAAKACPSFDAMKEYADIKPGRTSQPALTKT